MTTEQQRKILEAAAKTCKFKKWRVLTSGLFQVSNNANWNEAFAKWTNWNPLANSADTAEMCAKLNIDSYWWKDFVSCAIGREVCKAKFEDHSNSRLKAWMYAATIVAAKIGDLKSTKEN